MSDVYVAVLLVLQYLLRYPMAKVVYAYYWHTYPNYTLRKSFFVFLVCNVVGVHKIKRYSNRKT